MCSYDKSLVTVAFLWQKLSKPQFYKDLTIETAFFEGWSWFSFNNLWTGTRYKLEILHQCNKRVTNKSQKVLGASSYVCRSCRGKGRGGLFAPLTPRPSAIELKLNIVWIIIKRSIWTILTSALLRINF